MEQCLELLRNWAAHAERYWYTMPDAPELGAVGLYGARELVVDRASQRRGGRYASLHVDEICFPAAVGVQPLEPHAVALDVGWAVLSAVDAAQIRDLESAPIQDGPVRGARLRGADGHGYVVLVNFADTAARYPLDRFDSAPVRDLAADRVLAPLESLDLPPCRVRVLSLGE